MKTDVEEPDMYVPFMGFITYTILYVLHLGVIEDNFQPDVFGTMFGWAVGLLAFELVLVKGAFFLAGSGGVSSFDLAAITGYKYVHLSFIMFFFNIMGHFYYVLYGVFFYFAVAAAFAESRFLSHIRNYQS